MASGLAAEAAVDNSPDAIDATLAALELEEDPEDDDFDIDIDMD